MSRRLTAQAGTSTAELVVTVGVIAVVLGMGVVGIRQSYFDFSTSRQRIVNDLRVVRANASTRGAHYRVSFNSDSYEIERLQDEDGDGYWDSDAQQEAQRINMPETITLTVTSGEPAVEFDTRGMVVPPDDQRLANLMEIMIADDRAGESARVEVWPSGQVQLAGGGLDSSGDDDDDNGDDDDQGEDED